MDAPACTVLQKRWDLSPEIDTLTRENDHEGVTYLDSKICFHFEPNLPILYRKPIQVPFPESAFTNHLVKEKHNKYSCSYDKVIKYREEEESKK